ncbi:MAG: hypothetical protein GX868_11490 [Actinobacteria bacterium]|nr:hypothetical protein [Actinomycetota bacterium]
MSNAEAQSDPLEDSPNEPTFAAGVEHLQSAANELIEAARTFLNVVEDVVSDREKLHAATTGLVDLLDSAGGALSGLVGRAAANSSANASASGSAARSAGNAASAAPTGPTRGVRRIDLDDE